VISGSALRVADAVRILKDKRLRGEKGGDVAKLFAKHFKLEDHVNYLRRTKLAVAVGTPGRIGKLLTDTGASSHVLTCISLTPPVDALGMTALSHVILDVSHLDAKKRSLLDIPENRDEVFKYVLGAPKLLNAVKQGKVQIVLF
jgi:protein CMS1